MTSTTSTPPLSDADNDSNCESFKENPPPPRRRAQDDPRRRGSLKDWRETASMSVEERLPKSATRQIAEIDDEDGKAQFFLTLLFQSIEDSATFFAGTILFLVIWAIVCSLGAQELRARAAADPGGFAEQWLEDVESCKNAVSVLGSLFVFTLVFRFNACYDRWWESRIFWGDIIYQSA